MKTHMPTAGGDLTKVTPNMNRRTVTAYEITDLVTQPPDDRTPQIAIQRALGAVAPVARRTGLSRTDVLNWAARLYPAVTELSFWAAFRLLLAERAELRRLSAAHRARLTEEA